MKTFSQHPILIGLFLVCKWTQATPTKYDQRQTGDVNVQVHLKDVQVVALIDTEFLDDYTDYNYAYDYSDFTIKPIVKPTTSSGSTTTVKPWTTWPTYPPSSSIAENQTSSTTPTTTIHTTPKSDHEPVTTSNQLNHTLVASEILPHTTMQTGDDMIAVEKLDLKSQRKKCRSGFAVDSKGRCRTSLRRRLSFLPFAMTLMGQKGQRGITKDLRMASWTSTQV